MGISKYLGMNIMNALALLKNEIAILEYVKIEGDEFLKAPEKGFYLQSKDDSGIISAFRIFLEADGPYFPASSGIRGEFANLFTLKDVEKSFGPALKNIPSLKIPGAEKTLPGKKFEDENLILLAHYNSDEKLVFLHIKQKYVGRK